MAWLDSLHGYKSLLLTHLWFINNIEGLTFVICASSFLALHVLFLILGTTSGSLDSALWCTTVAESESESPRINALGTISEDKHQLRPLLLLGMLFEGLVCFQLACQTKITIKMKERNGWITRARPSAVFTQMAHSTCSKGKLEAVSQVIARHAAFNSSLDTFVVLALLPFESGAATGTGPHIFRWQRCV